MVGHSYRLAMAEFVEKHPLSTCLQVRSVQMDTDDGHPWPGEGSLCPMRSPYRVSKKHVQRLTMSVTCSSLYPSVTGLSCPEALIQPSPRKPWYLSAALSQTLVPGKDIFTRQTWR